MSYVDLDYVDPKIIREYNNHYRGKEKESKRIEMINGDRDPIDKNFNIITHGQLVYIKTTTTPIIGSIRLSKARDAYIVETEECKTLTYRMIRPDSLISSDKPVVFDIMKPNHRMVFLSMKDLEMSDIEFITLQAQRYKVTVADLLGDIHDMIEKYPEEFI